ncbi:MAG: hypothetical protein DMG50_22580 [Acidobacteria bacterium]|nr:MAG: hypothetical protein DMG50_22580 [Acidobacteriota bacterium]
MPEHSWSGDFPSGTTDPEISSPGSAALVTPIEKNRGWIESPAYDVGLFALSPVAGLLLILVDQMSRWGHAAGELAIYFVGIPHYLSSFTFYLGDQNRDYYRLRWAAFFLGPLVIFASVLGLRALAVQGVVQSAIFVWNVYHVSLQSAGVLSLYRRLNGGEQTEKRWAHLTILSVNATMAFWFLNRFLPLYQLLVRVHPWTPIVLRYVCLATVLVAGSGYALHLSRRPRPVRLPEQVFLISSLLLFHPYLWVKDYLLATIAMLMGHFIQYLGIIWLLNRRKYGQQTSGSLAQQWLIRLSSRPRLLLVSLLLLGGFFLFIDRGSRIIGMYLSYIIVWNSLVLIHFYVDGLVWAFKDSFVRKTVGPYLVLESHEV